MTIRKCLPAALVFLLTACSISISDITPVAGHVTVIPKAGDAPTIGIIQTVTPGLTPLVASVPWTDLNLTGSLIYTQGKLGLLKLNLVTGQETTLLAHDEKMWLRDATESPDGKTIAITYSPPPPTDQVQLGYTGLYQIAADGSTPSPIPIEAQVDPQESYFALDWTPDGKYLYYSHFIPVKSTPGPQDTFRYTIERIAYPDGKPEVILQDAIWPKISPDGTKLLYLKFDTVQYTQLLYTSDLDGQNPAPVLPNSNFSSVDSQFYSPDGQTILFNAVSDVPTPAPASFSWLDRLMGVNAVEAHNVPSDWWSITQGQSEPVRVTKLYDTGMYGDFSPDGKHVAFLAASGMYVMDPDGQNLTPLVPIKSVGTLEWEP